MAATLLAVLVRSVIMNMCDCACIRGYARVNVFAVCCSRDGWPISWSGDTHSAPTYIHIHVDRVVTQRSRMMLYISH